MSLSVFLFINLLTPYNIKLTDKDKCIKVLSFKFNWSNFLFNKFIIVYELILIISSLK